MIAGAVLFALVRIFLIVYNIHLLTWKILLTSVTVFTAHATLFIRIIAK